MICSAMVLMVAVVALPPERPLEVRQPTAFRGASSGSSSQQSGGVIQIPDCFIYLLEDVQVPALEAGALKALTVTEGAIVKRGQPSLSSMIANRWSASSRRSWSGMQPWPRRQTMWKSALRRRRWHTPLPSLTGCYQLNGSPRTQFREQSWKGPSSPASVMSCRLRRPSSI